MALSGNQRGNAIGSLLATGSGLFLLFILPPVLVRHLGVGTYTSWALAAEFASYVALLEVGSSLGAATLVAANPGLDPHEVGRSMRRISWILAGTATVLLVAFSLALSAVVGAGRGDADLTRLLVLILGVPSVCYVATSYSYGILIGRGRLLAAGISVFAGRAVAAALVIAACAAGASPVELAVCWVVPSSLGYIGLPRLARGERGGDPVSAQCAVGLRQQGWVFAGGFATWAVAGFLVVGLDTTIVAATDLKAVSAYAIAASFALLVQAGLSALLAPMVPRIRSFVSAGELQKAKGEVLGLVRVAALVGVVACAVLATDGQGVMSLFAGIVDARAGLILGILLAAAALRLALLPMSNAVFALGAHTKNWWIPLIEGSVNVTTSLILAPSLGALGVAFGTLVGSCAGVVVTLTLLSRRVAALTMPRMRDVTSMYLAMGVAVGVAVGINWRLGSLRPSTGVSIALVVGSAALSLSLLGPFVARHYRPRQSWPVPVRSGV